MQLHTPTPQRPWSMPQLQATLQAAAGRPGASTNMARALLQMALLELALTGDPARAGGLVDRVAAGSRKACAEITALLDAHHQLVQPPPPALPPPPLTSPQFDRAYPQQSPPWPATAPGPATERLRRQWRDRVAEPAAPPPPAAAPAPVRQPRQRRRPADPTPHLPPHRHPPLQPCASFAGDRLSLLRWAEKGLPGALAAGLAAIAPVTVAAVYTRLFGVSPPRAQDRHTARGYTRRELGLIVQAINDHRSPD